MRMRRLLPVALALASCTADDSTEQTSSESLGQIPQSTNPYTLFETLQVRPVALSPNGKLLFVANTPDDRLEIFKVGSAGLTPLGSVPVGLEPTAVAARTDDEVWVVNHLSDSVSVVKVELGGLSARVARTLQVGDEPRDIVFAGTNRNRAFITTAHRGQNTGDPYDLQTAGVGRADVWVFDAANLGSAAGGTRLAKLSLFADTPRALAVSADGKTVYAAAFHSGNQTTSVSVEAVQKVYGGTMPGPATITIGGVVIPQPPTGLIVKYKDGHWVDAYGTNFDAYVKVKLPDEDVFQIDATATPPTMTRAFPHVGTVLFNMAVNPKSGKVYVTNTDARNDIRFEGHTPGFTSVRGHIADNRITVLDPSSGAVAPALLNTHIDYEGPGSAEEKALSVAFPQDVVVSKDGTTLYTVAQGSGKLAIYSTAAIEAGAVTPDADDQVMLSGGGPSGVALDEARGRAYVLTRFDNSVSVVDLDSREEIGKVSMFNPEPESVTVGRQFLYDADFSSAHGDSACATCHVGGDNDDLGWDLGNPGGIPLSITKLGNVFTIPPAVIIQLLPRFAPIFEYNMPLKGPMTTQSLRGMDNHGSMHWRGDRNGAVQQSGAPFIDPATGQPMVSAQPNAGLFDEMKAFTSFNVAFPGLIGRDEQLDEADMQAFAEFILQVVYPPNPIRNLDNSLTAQQAQGRTFYFAHTTLPDGTVKDLPSDRFHNCNGCHTLDLEANAAVTPRKGFFGSDGKLSFEFETQIFKVPHLRNMYTKVGMFGSSPDSLQPGTIILQQGPATDQIRGYGFQHDGSLGTLEHFFTGQVFMKAPVPVTLPDGTVVPPNPFGIPFVDPNTLFDPAGPVILEDGGFALRAAIVAFMFAFDSNMAPIVGQQVTLTAGNASTAGARIDVMKARADAGECDLVVKGSLGPIQSGFLYTGGKFQPGSTLLPPISDSSLRGLVSIGLYKGLTYTCVPPGSGARIAIDRDGDGWADGDEVLKLTDPANPSSHP